MGETNTIKNALGQFEEKNTRTCKVCRREKDKLNAFYSPTDDVCIECNPTWVFIKRIRKLGRTKGLAAIQDKINEYQRKLKLMEDTLATMGVKEKHKR